MIGTAKIQFISVEHRELRENALGTSQQNESVGHMSDRYRTFLSLTRPADDGGNNMYNTPVKLFAYGPFRGSGHYRNHAGMVQNAGRHVSFARSYLQPVNDKTG